MQRLMSKRAQLIDAVVSLIIWVILTSGLLYAFLTNQFPTVTGKVTGGILIIVGVLFIVNNVRFYLRSRQYNEEQ